MKLTLKDLEEFVNAKITSVFDLYDQKGQNIWRPQNALCLEEIFPFHGGRCCPINFMIDNNWVMLT